MNFEKQSFGIAYQFAFEVKHEVLKHAIVSSCTSRQFNPKHELDKLVKDNPHEEYIRDLRGRMGDLDATINEFGSMTGL